MGLFKISGNIGLYVLYTHVYTAMCVLCPHVCLYVGHFMAQNNLGRNEMKIVVTLSSFGYFMAVYIRGISACLFFVKVDTKVTYKTI